MTLHMNMISQAKKNSGKIQSKWLPPFHSFLKKRGLLLSVHVTHSAVLLSTLTVSLH